MESRPESSVPAAAADSEPPISSPEKDSIQVVDNATGTTGSKICVSSASPVVENAAGSIDNDPNQVLPTMNDKADSQKRAKTLSFLQRMAGQPAPASSAASAISADKHEIVPYDKDLEESLPITNEGTGSQKNTKMVSFFQRMGGRAGLGPDPNKSELSDAFASWVGDRNPHATLTDELLIQPQTTASASELLNPLISIYKKSIKKKKKKPVPELEQVDMTQNTVRAGRMQLQFSASPTGDDVVSDCKVDNWFGDDSGVATGDPYACDTDTDDDTDTNSDSSDFDSSALDRLFGSAAPSATQSTKATVTGTAAAAAASADPNLPNLNPSPSASAAGPHPEGEGILRDGLSKSRLSRPMFTPLAPPVPPPEAPVIEAIEPFEIDPDFDYDNCPCSSRIGSENVGVINNTKL